MYSVLITTLLKIPEMRKAGNEKKLKSPEASYLLSFRENEIRLL